MSTTPPRAIEIRLIVLVLVDLTDPGITEALAAPGINVSSLTDVVASEIASNLESISYVTSTVVSPL